MRALESIKRAVIIRRLLFALLLSSLLTIGFSSVVSAASAQGDERADRACLGEFVSSLATHPAFHPFGSIISFEARFVYHPFGAHVSEIATTCALPQL